MPKDPEATPEATADPTEDTQQVDSEDTDQDTQEAQQPVDWEARYKELQRHARRVEQENSVLRRSGTDDEGDEDEGDEDVGNDGPVAAEPSGRLLRESWELARATYGDTAIEAYERAFPLVERAQTPADFVAAFEAYHEARSKGATPAQAAKKAKAVPPAEPVDPNRSDAGPDAAAIDKQIEAAKAQGDSRGFIEGLLRRAGVN